MKHNLMSGHASIRIVRCIPQVPIGQTSQVLYKSTEIFWNKMAAQSWQFVLPEPVHTVHLVSQATQPSGFSAVFPQVPVEQVSQVLEEPSGICMNIILPNPISWYFQYHLCGALRITRHTGVRVCVLFPIQQ